MAGSIDPAPYIEPRGYPCDGDPSKGYIVLIVPQSPLAPHQVTVGGDFRFYGRGAQGNRLLTASDVERLHARRQRWEVDRQARLVEVIAHAPYPPQDDLAYLHAFCQPIPPDRALWQRYGSGPRGAARLVERCRAIDHGRPAPRSAKCVQSIPRGASWRRAEPPEAGHDGSRTSGASSAATTASCATPHPRRSASSTNCSTAKRAN